MRTCSKCGPTEAAFPKTGAVCKPCMRLYKQKNYVDHRVEINAKNLANYHRGYDRYSAQKKARYAANPEPAKAAAGAARLERKRLIDGLKNRPCMDCRNTFPSVCMDFDHRPGEKKVACVGQLKAWTAPIEMILEEIAKCDLVCSNCHRIRTETRRLERAK